MGLFSFLPKTLFIHAESLRGVFYVFSEGGSGGSSVVMTTQNQQKSKQYLQGLEIGQSWREMASDFSLDIGHGNFSELLLLLCRPNTYLPVLDNIEGILNLLGIQ